MEENVRQWTVQPCFHRPMAISSETSAKMCSTLLVECDATRVTRWASASHSFKPFSSYLALASDCAYPLVHGVESQPSARLKHVGQCNRPPTDMSPAPLTTMKLTPPASLGKQGFKTLGFYPKAFPAAILVIAYWDQGKDSAFPYLFGVAFLRTANVSFPHLSLISFPSDQVSPTEKAKLW